MITITITTLLILAALFEFLLVNKAEQSRHLPFEKCQDQMKQLRLGREGLEG